MFAVVMTFGFISCSSDDDEPEAPSELVTPTLPTSNGWSGDFENGVAKFADLSESDDPEEGMTYMAFSFKDGICTDGVVNIVMPSEEYAKGLEQMLKSGIWNGDDEEDYIMASAVFHMNCSVMKAVSRADMIMGQMPINVSRKGKVVYQTIPNIKGLTGIEVRNAVKLWNDGDYTPTKVVFGKYENGVYTCSNTMGIGMDYHIDTKFNADGYCTKYVTTLTFASQGWAQMMYDQLNENIQDDEDIYVSLFGKKPVLTLNGRTVVLEAVISENVRKSDVEDLIIALDWHMNRPILWDIF